MRLINVTEWSKLTEAQLRGHTMDNYGFRSVLSWDNNPKTIKGNKAGYLTGIVYLIPNDEICPSSRLAGCRNDCLVNQGRGVMHPVKRARKGRTDCLKHSPDLFFTLLLRDIDKLHNRARKIGAIPCIRLNGMSDIDWSQYLINTGSGVSDTIFGLYSGTQFYDYTKRPDIIRKSALFHNWYTCASFSGANDKYTRLIVGAAVRYGANLVVVFAEELPDSFLGYLVINGDETDLRFLDAPGHVVGLYAKGSAKHDTSGFVVRDPASFEAEVCGVAL